MKFIRVLKASRRIYQIDKDFNIRLTSKEKESIEDSINKQESSEFKHKIISLGRIRLEYVLKNSSGSLKLDLYGINFSYRSEQEKKFIGSFDVDFGMNNIKFEFPVQSYTKWSESGGGSFITEHDVVFEVNLNINLL